MGESRGGEGRAEGPTTSLLARYLVRQYESDNREVAQIRIERATEGLYAVYVMVHGENEPEAFFLVTEKDPPASRTRSAPGSAGGKPKGD